MSGRPNGKVTLVTGAASDAAAFVTGRHFVIDGGIAIGPRGIGHAGTTRHGPEACPQL